MQELDITWDRTLRVWWAFFWRGVAYVMVPAFVFGAVVGLSLALAKIPIEPHLWKLQAVSGTFGLVAGIWITKIVLGKSYSGFRIALVALPERGEQVRDVVEADGSAPRG